MSSGLSGQNDTLYLKLERSVLSYGPVIFMKDVGGLECSNPEILARVKAIKIYEFRHPGNMVCTITRLIQEVHKIYPQLEVVSLGEMDVILEYREKKPSDASQRIKLGLVCVLLFFGAAFTIVAFHNDIGIADVFERFYQQVVGGQKPEVSLIEISYSIGLAVGITVFYNHFGKKKITHDPTPIQVEMRKYEQDTDTAIIENSARRGENLDVS